MHMRFLSFTKFTAAKYIASFTVFGIILPNMATARADVKIISTATTAGAPKQMQGNFPGAGDTPQTIVTYYKGDRQRTEIGDKITIYDGPTDKLYTLDAKTRTYTVSNVGDVANGAPASILAMLDIKTTAAAQATGETKTVAGKPAKKYLYTALLTFSLKGAEETRTPTLPSVQIQGEQWTTESLVTSAPVERMQRLNFLRRIPGVEQGSLRPLLEQMATIKGLPLYNRVTVRTAAVSKMERETAAEAKKNGKGDGTLTVVTITEAQQIREEALPDSLFTIPEGYTEKTDVPRPRGASFFAPPSP